MATIIPAGFAQCTLIWTASGDNEPMNCVFGVALESGISDPLAVANDMQAAWAQAWLPATLSNRYVFQGVRVTIGNDGPDPGPTSDFILPVAGTSSTTFLPSNCALLVRKRTNFGGRTNRGRFFLPAGYIKESDADENGQLQTASQTAFQSNMTAFLTNIAAKPSTASMVILHDSSSPGTHVPTVVQNLSVDNRIATQRLRMRR
jgi:hypothetical protein